MPDGTGAPRSSLEVASDAFMAGYELAARSRGTPVTVDVVRALEGLGTHRSPFAFEGAGMACRLDDERRPGSARAEALVSLSAPVWRLFVRLGEGCAIAKLGGAVPADPDAQDGFGFQSGLDAGRIASRLEASAPRVGVGLGRALWFGTGGDVESCAAILAEVDDPAEWWRGVGTACVFAGDPHGHAARVSAAGGSYAHAVLRGAERAGGLWELLPGETPVRVTRALDEIRTGCTLSAPDAR